jgi:hypothetical protein
MQKWCLGRLRGQEPIRLAAGAGPNMSGAERPLAREKVGDGDTQAREDERVAT